MEEHFPTISTGNIRGYHRCGAGPVWGVPQVWSRSSVEQVQCGAGPVWGVPQVWSRSSVGGTTGVEQVQCVKMIVW